MKQKKNKFDTKIMIVISKSRTAVVNIFPLLAGVIILMFISSCTQNVDGVIDLPYTEQIVIRGILENGKAVKGIMLTKTQPALDTFEMQKAEIKDAVAEIKCDGVSYPLKYRGNALFDCDSLTAQSGKAYTITVRWNGKTAYATTTVPYPKDYDSLQELPPVKSRRSQLWTYRIGAYLNMPPNDVVVSGYELIDSLGQLPTIKNYASRAYIAQDTLKGGKIRTLVFTQILADTNKVQYDTASYRLHFFVETYDQQFYEYFRTRNSGDSPNSTFGLSGSNIHWNVKGDGVGLFIGSATTRKRYTGLK